MRKPKYNKGRVLMCKITKEPVQILSRNFIGIHQDWRYFVSIDAWERTEKELRPLTRKEASGK